MKNEQEPEPEEPKKQLQTDRGGAGRGDKTAIGTGGNDDDDWAELPDTSEVRTFIWMNQDILRQGVRAMLEPVARIVGEADEAEIAISEISRLKPAIVIFDCNCHGRNPAEISKQFKGLSTAPTFLVYSDSFQISKYYSRLLRAGVKVFCLNSSGIRFAFDQAMKGQAYCDSRILELVSQTPTNTMLKTPLTPREIEVLIRLDLRNSEIAEELDIREKTVIKHIECILAKLKVPTRTAAALEAVQLGYTLLPIMPARDLETSITQEQKDAEAIAHWAIDRQKKRRRKAKLKSISLLRELTVKELAHKLAVPELEIIKRLMLKGFMRTINQIVEIPLAREVASDLGWRLSDTEDE